MKKSVHSPEQILLQNMLRDARTSAGLSQYDLADRLSRPQSFVSKYESGDRLLDVVELITILKSVGIKPAQFIDDLEAAMDRQARGHEDAELDDD